MREFLARPSWTVDALCRGTDPNLWFPARGESRSSRTLRQVCAACPVRPECVAYSMSAPEHGALGHGVIGVWGGLSDKGRRRLRTRGVVKFADGTMIDRDAVTGAVTVEPSGGPVLDPAPARELLDALAMHRAVAGLGETG